MVELNEQMKELAAEKFLVIVGTHRQDESIQMNPAWFEYADDGYFYLNSWRGSDWLRHIERDGNATLLVIDPQNNGRWMQVVGKLVETSDGEEGEEHIDQLSMRYMGRTYPQHNPARPRVKIQLDPVQITAPFAQGGRWGG